MLGDFIFKQRKKNNLSQEFLASKIGISRPTYVEVEKDERELTISEAQKLAAIFNLSLEELLSANQKEIAINFEEGKDQQEAKPKVRIILPQANVKKFKEVLLYLLEKVGARPNIGETAIYQLLYFIDFDYYERYGEQLIGALYIKNHNGPTPVEFKIITDQMIGKGEIEKIKSTYFQHDQKKYLPTRRANLKILSGQELQHIDEVLNRLAWKNADGLNAYAQTDAPLMACEIGEKINYKTVFGRDKSHSVRN